MSTFIKSKPRQSVIYKPQDDSKVFLHSGENKSAFSLATKYQNFLGEMMKFFPNFVQEGYATGQESTFTMDGIGTWASGMEENPADESAPKTRGWGSRGKLEEGYIEKYGDIHTTSLEGESWGYGAGKSAENINFQPDAAEFDHFTDMDIEGSYNPLDSLQYTNMLYGKIPTWGQLGTITAGMWTKTRNTLSQYSGKSYYQIVMEGVENATIRGSNINGLGLSINESKEDAEMRVNFNGAGFLYDDKAGTNGEGAFNLMLAIVESRRRINYAMSDLFGSPYMINYNQAMLSHINDTFRNPNKLGSLDAQNKRVFEAYFGGQHVLRAVLPMYSGGVTPVYSEDGLSITGFKTLELRGQAVKDPNDPDYSLNAFNQKDLGYTGYVYSARDIVGFQRFRHWILQHVNTYINSIDSQANDGWDKRNAQNLMNEFNFTYDQPYGADKLSQPVVWDSDEEIWKVGNMLPQYMGWDRFHSDWAVDPNMNSNAPEHYYSSYPNGASPYTTNYWDTNMREHKDYAAVQLINVNQSQMLGLSPVEAYVIAWNGRSYHFTVPNINQSNWVVNLEARFVKARLSVLADNMEAIFLTNMDRQRYRRDIKEYRKWKVEQSDAKYDEVVRDAQENKKRAERRRYLKRVAAKPKPSNDKGQSTKNSNSTTKKNYTQSDFQKAQKALRKGIMDRMISASKKRNKSSKAAGS